jgi:hypothetical protein
MKPRPLADADFNHKIVLGLRRRGPTIDFQTAHHGDVLGRPDPQVLSIHRIKHLWWAKSFLTTLFRPSAGFLPAWHAVAKHAAIAFRLPLSAFCFLLSAFHPGRLLAPSHWIPVQAYHVDHEAVRSRHTLRQLTV